MGGGVMIVSRDSSINKDMPTDNKIKHDRHIRLKQNKSTHHAELHCVRRVFLDALCSLYQSGWVGLSGLWAREEKVQE